MNEWLVACITWLIQMERNFAVLLLFIFACMSKGRGDLLVRCSFNAVRVVMVSGYPFDGSIVLIDGC